MLSFDWTSKSKVPTDATISLKVEAENSGTAHAVFMWWDIKMDEDHRIVLSCAPSWAHPDFHSLSTKSPKSDLPQNVIPWRDHWMQAVYYVPSSIYIQKGQVLYLNFMHDEYSLWFDVTKSRADLSSSRPPLCECGFHNAYSRTRIGQLNDSVRNKKYIKLLEPLINSQSVVLSLSDGSLLGLACSVLGAKQVICLEMHRYSRQVLSMYVEHNRLRNVRIVESLDEVNNWPEVTHVIGEPSFVSSIVPFDNFYFGTLLKQIQPHLRSDVSVLPMRAITYAVPVEFVDLQKIRAPLGVCEGFDLKIFDRLIEVRFLIMRLVVYDSLAFYFMFAECC